MINEALKMIITVSKGQQITIPSRFRKELKLHVGSKIEMIKKENKLIIQPLEEDISKLFADAIKTEPKYRLNAKEMDKIIEDEIFRQ